ncbi:MAG: M16 family metallopeptidase [Nitrospinota bacterium]
MRGSRTKQVVLALGYTLAVAALAAPAPAGAVEVPWEVSEHHLQNGIKVLLLEDHRAPVVVFQVWYRVGSRHERQGMTGMSHLLEHMMFKGTRRFGAKVFSNLIQRNGGSHNAFTSRDYTAYFERMASDRVELAMELEADRMMNLVLDPKELELERQVVLEERRTRTEDNPLGALYEEVHATAFRLHPYRNPIIGWPADLRAITVESMRRFYRRYYHPAHATIVAVGDFKTPQMLSLIRKHFGLLQPDPAPSPPRVQEPPPRGERRVELVREARLPALMLAYRVPNYRSPSAYALDVLAEVLAGGESSRLVQRLVYREGIALGVDADNDLLAHDPSLFTLTARISRRGTPERVEKAIEEELARIAREGVGAEELSRTKRRMEAELVFAMDSHFYRAMLLGRADAAGDWRLIQSYLRRIAAVTSEDVRRAAARHLRRENRTVGILRPAPPRAARAEKKRGGHP